MFVACVKYSIAVSIARVDEAFILDFKIWVQDRRYHNISQSEALFLCPTSSSVDEEYHIDSFYEQASCKDKCGLHSDIHPAPRRSFITKDTYDISSHIARPNIVPPTLGVCSVEFRESIFDISPMHVLCAIWSVEYLSTGIAHQSTEV